MNMRKQIILTVPEEIFEQATSIADATQQPLDKVFEDALEAERILNMRSPRFLTRQ